MAVDSTPLDVAALPAVLAGPILRRLTRTEVSVWVALSRGADVTLEVDVASGGPFNAQVSVSRTPVRVGANLFLATLTAPAPPPGGTFAAGTDYRYRLRSTGWPAQSQPNMAAFGIAADHPTFPGPPAAVEDTVIFHTSCRKAGGGGRDAMAPLADLIQQRVTAGLARPHLLVLSGDQIYADEIPYSMAPRIRRIAADLVRIDESAVIPFTKLGERTELIRSFGFTVDERNHLLTLGEFYATYLLYWSEVLWPAVIPTFDQIQPELQPDITKEAWDKARQSVETFRTVIPSVRKVLASVPTMMILDDHEVTDDWNREHTSVKKIYESPIGRRVSFNAMVAYALFQHWGNKPVAFDAAGSPEAALLSAVTWTPGSAASPESSATRAVVGIPDAPPPAPPPSSALRDLGEPGIIRYDWTLGPQDGWPLRLVALDERTAREFHNPDQPAGRISLAGLALQLPVPPPGPPAQVTVIVAPAPIIGTALWETLIQPAANLFPGGASFVDFESWSAATANFEDLLARLAAYAPVVVLSGDVHYGFSGALTYRSAGGDPAHIAQFTCSAAKNADLKHMLLHVLGEFATKVGLERPRELSGFAALSPAAKSTLEDPPPAGGVLPWDDIVDILLGRVFRAGQEIPAVLATPVAEAYNLGAPDWTYATEPVDDERFPASGPVHDAIVATPAAWEGFDEAKSVAMIDGLRAGDLHRLGRVFIAINQVGVVTFSGSPLTVQQRLLGPLGRQEPGPDPGSFETITSVVLG